MLKEVKVNELEVTVENLSFLDVFQIQKYLDDLEIAQRAFGVSQISNQLLENISKLKKSIMFNRSNFKAIKYNRKTVGFIQIFYEDYDKIKIGIVIGEKKYWGRNIGTIALKKFINQLFSSDQKLKTIYLDTANFNTNARRCFEKVGFKIYNEQNGKVFMFLDRDSFVAG